jgi:archaellum component FlaC
MAGRGSRYLVLVTGLLIVLLPAGGCRREKTPEAKQARLIAAESMQLKDRLADLENQIGKLRARHADDLKQREDRLAACRKRVETLEKDLQKGIAERVNSVTAAVMDENARLRQEIAQLRVEIERLAAQSSESP